MILCGGEKKSQFVSFFANLEFLEKLGKGFFVLVGETHGQLARDVADGSGRRHVGADKGLDGALAAVGRLRHGQPVATAYRRMQHR